jgi:hypothetical protein
MAKKAKKVGKKRARVPVRKVNLPPKTILRVVAPEGMHPVVMQKKQTKGEWWWEFMFGAWPIKSK